MTYLEKLSPEELSAIQNEAEFRALTLYRLKTLEARMEKHDGRIDWLETKAAVISAMIAAGWHFLTSYFKGGGQ